VDHSRVWVLQGKFPRNQGYYAEKVVLFLDQTLLLPIKVSVYDGEDTLLEEYVFHQLAINVGLTDHDFDPGNPDYDF
jgi:negative regulator of sigma E activity